MKELARYFDDGSVSGEYSQELDEAVCGVKNSEERKRDYMVMMAREMEIREEGREEGRQEGRLEGRGEGMNLFGILVKKLYTLGRSDEIERAAEDAQYRDALLKELQLA